MNRVLAFYTSSVGRKLLMGLTGFFLCSFLVVHLYINLFLFGQDGGKTFDAYAEFMASYPLVRPLEIVLFAGFLFHMILGVWLWWVNRRVRQTGYAVNRASDTSDLSSRIMWITGLVVLVFLSIHVYTFFWRSRFMDTGLTMYEMVQQAFSDPWYVAFYLVALVFLGYHLKHGFQSAFQTFGLRTSRYRRLIEWTAVLFWLVIPLAFAAMPVYFLWAYLNGVN
jgi:succinate dehydrogenase / fumarate reductase cytochrome b subunit